MTRICRRFLFDLLSDSSSLQAVGVMQKERKRKAGADVAEADGDGVASKKKPTQCAACGRKPSQVSWASSVVKKQGQVRSKR